MSHHPRWILQGLGGEPLIVQRFDAPREPGHEALPRTYVLGYLDRWLLDGQVRPAPVWGFLALPGPFAQTFFLSFLKDSDF